MYELKNDIKPFAIMSIKPEYAEKILSGEKQWEFRKRSMKNILFMDVLIYATSPIQKIVGEISFDGELYGNPSIVWHATEDQAGISDITYDRYYGWRDYHAWGSTIAYAAYIDATKVMSRDGSTLKQIRKRLKNYPNWMPPRSWIGLPGQSKLKNVFLGKR